MTLGRFALLLFAAVAYPAAAASAATHYVVAFNQPNGLPNNVDKLIADAGGTIVERLPQIGGVGVTSDNPDFIANILNSSSVKSADTATPMSLNPTWYQAADTSADSSTNNGGTASPTGSDAQPMPDPLGYEQWDKKKLNATLTGSYALQRGRKDVRVAVLDTGADQSHPDVAPNLDTADSRSFVPTEPTIQDFNGHGTWTISAVGAPINGIGISGVAPNVTLVELKVLSGAGSGDFIWLDQALVYAGLQHFDVASMSLGGYIPKCGNKHVDAQGNPICDHPDYILLNRAVQFARSNGVLPVAALGNDGFDLSDGNFFRDFVEAPGEIAGVVGVSATGYNDGKAFYSSYGMGKTDVSAPGGSTRDYTGVPGGATCDGHGSLCRLIGAWSSTASSAPSDPVESCAGPGGTPPCALYGYVQGTSMATPNVAGVAALIISQFGDFSSNNQNKPHMSPTQVESILQITANNQPCPTPKTVTQGPGFTLATATCQGDTGYNSFFGKGIVDAVKAITK
ncbi:MAG TPA: S8 family serine peptidase [Myxococcales bacterium]|nr:S8 family serine peptidase [Myxococcales bacterium]